MAGTQTQVFTRQPVKYYRREADASARPLRRLLTQPVEETEIVGVQAAVGQLVDEFRTALHRALERLVTTPAVHQRVVSGAQDIGHGQLPPDLGARVAGAFEQAVRE